MSSTETLGASIDRLHDLREQKRKAEAAAKKLEGEIKPLENEVMERMDAEQVGSSAGKLASVSISENVVPTVKDWDAFYTYILRNKAFYLLERRPTAIAYREELDTRNGKLIPGVESYTRRTLNLRSK